MTKIINRVDPKITTVIGSHIGENETKQMHTATCTCGNRIIRAQKQESLAHYINNPKFNAKCCGNPLSYTGEKFFKGNQLFQEAARPLVVPTKKDKKLKKENTENKITVGTPNPIMAQETNNVVAAQSLALEVTDNVAVEHYIKNNGHMIQAFKENINNPQELEKLFSDYEDIFIKSVRYMSDGYKNTLLGVIQKKYPNARLEYRTHHAKHVVL